MPLTPGSSSILSNLKGAAKVIEMNSTQATAKAANVYPADLFIFNATTGEVFLTDGTTALGSLVPLLDKTISHLTSAERTAISNAFQGTGGAYALAAGGVIVADSTGQIDDAALKLIDPIDGKVKDSYLKFIDSGTGKLDLSYLPDTLRAKVTYVANITARDALPATGEERKGLVFVIDASDDSTVDSGAATYVWNAAANSGTGEWIKVSEEESLDLDIDALTPSHDNVQAAGAVMYDHNVLLGGLTLDEYDTLTAGSNSGSQSLEHPD